MRLMVTNPEYRRLFDRRIEVKTEIISVREMEKKLFSIFERTGTDEDKARVKAFYARRVELIREEIYLSRQITAIETGTAAEA